MIILFDCIFGSGKLIVFNIVEWIKQRIGIPTKVFGDCGKRLNFPVSAIITRHEVTCSTYVKK